MTEPTTEAGRRLLVGPFQAVITSHGPTLTVETARLRDAILAIEAEARADEVATCVERGHLTAADLEQMKGEARATALDVENVQRYELIVDHTDAYMELNPEGEYVLYEEVARLAREGSE